MKKEKNIAIIFAGGVGKRMGNTIKPKQFLEISGVPIIIHTLTFFEKNKNIDSIIISCLDEWIDYLQNLIEKYHITKVVKIVKGGATGQMSIFNALNVAHEMYDENSIVLIHDGVRPFISNSLIDDNIKNVKKKRSAISSVNATETFVLVNDNCDIDYIPQRKKSLIAKAPQSFYLGDIYAAHLKAQKEELFDSIDSCSLMNKYGFPLSIVMTTYDNIKITTPKDLVLAESIFERMKKEK